MTCAPPAIDSDSGVMPRTSPSIFTCAPIGLDSTLSVPLVPMRPEGLLASRHAMNPPSLAATTANSSAAMRHQAATPLDASFHG